MRLLPKQRGESLTSHMSLWVKVLKSIYFPKGAFVDAKKASQASTCWSSMIDRRDFLKKNILWDLGNGESIKIWDDP